MGKQIITTLLVIVTTIIAQVQAFDSSEENVSMAELASFIKQNFRELFQRLDSLESKMNKLISTQENCQLEERGSGVGEIKNNDGSPDGFNETGAVAVTSGSNESEIYFVTRRGAVSTYSFESMEVKDIANSSERLLGIAYDSIHKKLYWSDHDGKIYRANKDGSEAEIVLHTYQYGNFWGLAFDWIVGNIYGSTYDGYILACNTSTAPELSCFTVLSDQTVAIAIALNPTEGTMYWTRHGAGSLHKASMDGSSPTTILTELHYPCGITIDFDSRRLYWTEYSTHRIQTSGMDGEDIRTAVELPLGSAPHGIALSKDRIYWGNYVNNKLQRSTRDGRDIQTLYTETDEIKHIILVPAWNQPTNRTNHCEGQNCTTVCVLTPTCFRCLA